ncbi:hypothetical protein TSMEX_002942 [Taenia solium]|eukprot:TsM_000874800 transcript=TsM_000874800 gene=TsM_000874800
MYTRCNEHTCAQPTFGFECFSTLTAVTANPQTFSRIQRHRRSSTRNQSVRTFADIEAIHCTAVQSRHRKGICLLTAVGLQPVLKLLFDREEKGNRIPRSRVHKPAIHSRPRTTLAEASPGSNECESRLYHEFGRHGWLIYYTLCLSTTLFRTGLNMLEF